MLAINVQLITLDMMETWRCRSCLTVASRSLTVFYLSSAMQRTQSVTFIKDRSYQDSIINVCNMSCKVSLIFVGF